MPGCAIAACMPDNATLAAASQPAGQVHYPFAAIQFEELGQQQQSLTRGRACRVCGLNSQVTFTPEGRAWNPDGPSTGSTANTALLAAIYGQVKSQYITGAQSDRYICFARGQMRYVLGDKGSSLMVGYGAKFPTHVQVLALLGVHDCCCYCCCCCLFQDSIKLQGWSASHSMLSPSCCGTNVSICWTAAAAAAARKTGQNLPRLLQGWWDACRMSTSSLYGTGHARCC